MDPDGVEMRKKRRLKRRQYSAPVTIPNVPGRTNHRTPMPSLIFCLVFQLIIELITGARFTNFISGA